MLFRYSRLSLMRYFTSGMREKMVQEVHKKPLHTFTFAFCCQPPWYSSEAETKAENQVTLRAKVVRICALSTASPLAFQTYFCSSFFDFRFGLHWNTISKRGIRETVENVMDFGSHLASLLRPSRWRNTSLSLQVEVLLGQLHVSILLLAQLAVY